MKKEKSYITTIKLWKKLQIKTSVSLSTSEAGALSEHDIRLLTSSAAFTNNPVSDTDNPKRGPAWIMFYSVDAILKYA